DAFKTRISASSAARDRSRSITIPKISLHKSNIEQQHRLILDQPPAGWGLRQGHGPLRQIGKLLFFLCQLAFDEARQKAQESAGRRRRRRLSPIQKIMAS